MKEFTVNADSWHFRMANHGRTRVRGHDLRNGTDICTYLRHIFKGLSWMLFKSVGVIVLTAWAAFSVYDGVRALLGYEVITITTPIFWTVVGGMVGAVALIGAIEWTKESIRKHRYEQKFSGKEVHPSFLSLAYRKFKDKTCFKIKFED